MEFLLWLIGWHYVSGLGITIGYHRLLTHRAFQCPKWLEYCWATLGLLTLMSPPISWVAVHRCHHANTDKPTDPHSPAHPPNGKWGWWWAQLGWIAERVKLKKKILASKVPSTVDEADTFTLDSLFLKKWAHDLLEDPFYRRLTVDSGWLLWALTVLVSFLIGGWPAALGRLVATGTLFWCTWFVNSYGHIEGIGYRNFPTKDNSQNVWWVALLTSGEGWHNNHHFQPASARHGMRPWEFDASWVVIWCMEKLGLAWNVHTFKNIKSDRADAA